MEQPAQRQPVDRQYMRLVVGRGSRPPPRAGEPSESNARRQRRGRGRTSAEGSEGKSPRRKLLARAYHLPQPFQPLVRVVGEA